LLLINIKEIGSTFLNHPSFSCNSLYSIFISEVLFGSYLKSLILLDDNVFFNSNNFLFNLWNVSAWTINQPFVCWESVNSGNFVVEWSHALNSQSAVLRNGSVRLVLLLKDFVDLEGERLRPLFVLSDLNLSKLDLRFSKVCHDDFSLLVSANWISDDTIVSWGNMDHLDWAENYFLVIFEDEEKRPRDQLCDVGVQVFEVHVFID